MAADITWHTFNSLSACGFMFRSNGNTNKPTQYMVIITRYATGYLAFTATVKGEMSNMRTIYLQARRINASPGRTMPPTAWPLWCAAS